MAQCEIKTKNHHTDNGIFAAIEFQKEIENSQQTILFYGVNIHYQNRVTECCVRTISEHARAILLDAQTKWPKIISIYVWLYTVNYAIDINNSIFIETINKNPEILLTGTDTDPRLKKKYLFGCPSLLLDSRLVTGNKIS